jgi:hypothetical protein
LSVSRLNNTNLDDRTIRSSRIAGDARGREIDSARVAEAEGDRSPELDQVRQMLFPQLPPGEGWARIDAAISGAKDPQRAEAIERLAAGDLSEDLVSLLRLLREQ